MRTPVIAFFNLKGGVGKTTLAFHLAWMFSELGYRTLAADLDPQSSLTGLFVGTDKAAELAARGQTVYESFRPLVRGDESLKEAFVYDINERLALLAGDLSLYELGSLLSGAWDQCLTGSPQAAHAVTSVHAILQDAARRHASDLIFLDLAPALGLLNKMALAAADYLVIPVVPDALAVRGLQLVGHVLEQWSREWMMRLPALRAAASELPDQGPQPLGYILLKVRMYQGTPIHSMQHWMEAIPAVFHRDVLKDSGPWMFPPADPNCLAVLRENHLLSMAAEVNKPVFQLSPADGALGSYLFAARQAGEEYKALANTLATRAGLPSRR